MTAVVRRGMGVALFAWALGCATAGLSREELPEDPIAFLYWEAEPARRRAEMIEAAPRRRRRGVAEAESLGTLLGLATRSDPVEVLARYPGRLTLLNPRTGERSTLDAVPPGARPLDWSADRRRLLFTSGRISDRHQLYVYDFDADEVRPLTHGEWIHAQGVFGPDDRLLYAGLRLTPGGLEASIFQASASGGRSRVVARGAAAHGLAWSPDGEEVVYVRRDERPGGGGRAAFTLVVRPADPAGSDRALVPGHDPVFTPDGAWIVYSAPVRGDWKLRRIRSDGSGRALVGQSLRNERAPAVSPDGRFVVYLSDEAGRGLLFARRFDGSGDRVLLADGAVESPVW